MLAKPKLFNTLILIVSSSGALIIALFWVVIIVAEDQMELISLHHWLDAEANTYEQSYHDTHRYAIHPNPYEFDFYVDDPNLPKWLSSYQSPGFYEHHLGPEDKHFLVRKSPSNNGLLYIVFKENADDYLDSYETKLVLFSLTLGTIILGIMVALGFYLVRVISLPLNKIHHKITQMDPQYPLFSVDAKYQETYMDAPVMSTHYLSLRADFQHELRSLSSFTASLLC